MTNMEKADIFFITVGTPAKRMEKQIYSLFFQLQRKLELV